MLAVSTSAFAMTGESSEEKPFVATNEDELKLLNSFPNCYFEIGNDIELTKGVFVESFTGSLDGKSGIFDYYKN